MSPNPGIQLTANQDNHIYDKSFYVQFVYYNPWSLFTTDEQKWIPLPGGFLVEAWDYDPISDDVLEIWDSNDIKVTSIQTSGTTIKINVKAEQFLESKADIYFKIKLKDPNKKFLRLTAPIELLDNVDNPSAGFPYIQFPEEIMTKGKKTWGTFIKDKKWTERSKTEFPELGYLDDYDGPGFGTQQNPWKIKLEDIRVFAKIRFLTNRDNTYIGMPRGLSIEAYDYDAISSNEWQGKSCIWDINAVHGIAYIPIFNKDEKNPDIYLSIKNDGTRKLYLDRRGNGSYLFEAGDNPAISIMPDLWESKEVKEIKINNGTEERGDKGIKNGFNGTDIGSLSAPWLFNYEPPLQDVVIIRNAQDCKTLVQSIAGRQWDDTGVNIIGLRNNAVASGYGSNRHDDILFLVIENVLRGVFACSIDPGIIRPHGRVSHLAPGQHQYQYCHNNFKESGKKYLFATSAHQNLDTNADGRIDENESATETEIHDLQIHCGGRTMDDFVNDLSHGCTAIVCNVWFALPTNQRIQTDGWWGGPAGAVGEFMNFVHANTGSSGIDTAGSRYWGRTLDNKIIYYTVYNKNDTINYKINNIDEPDYLKHTYEFYTNKLRGV